MKREIKSNKKKIYIYKGMNINNKNNMMLRKWKSPLFHVKNIELIQKINKRNSFYSTGIPQKNIKFSIQKNTNKKKYHSKWK